MKQKVSIETIVISYYTSRPSRDLVTAALQQVTREWWEDMLQQFDAYISALVIEEAKGGDSYAAVKRLDAITEMPVIKVSDEAGNLAGILVSSGTIPEEHSEDALHIVLATVNGEDNHEKRSYC